MTTQRITQVLVQARRDDRAALGHALEGLDAIDAQLCRHVALRYFGPLTIPETAEVLGLSTTVERKWVTAHAWMRSETVGQEARR